MKRIEYTNGQVLGSLEFIRDAESQPRRQRNGYFLCKCGKEFIASIISVKTGKIVSCGCKKRQDTIDRNYKHGLATSRFWRMYDNIKRRCYNPKNNSYKNYGGRGITLADYWMNDRLAFMEYIKGLPGSDNPKLSLDRINNDGNYEVGNLRWVNRQIQATNQRRQPHTYQYIGVYPSKLRFAAALSHNNKQIYVGLFKTEKEAAIARDLYILENNLSNQLNILKRASC